MSVPASGSTTAGRSVLAISPQTSNTTAYLFADSAQIYTLELGLLTENQDGPMIQEDRAVVRDIIRWKVRHVFGAKFLDDPAGPRLFRAAVGSLFSLQLVPRRS